LGAIASVSVINNAFSPSTSSINVGDTVIWTWGTGSDSHNVISTSSSFAWLFPNTGGTTGNQNNSNLKTAPFAFTNTFTTAGSYPYECTEHVSLGMVGTVKVTAVNVPPGVAITNPVAGMVFAAPANVTIQAAVTNGTGLVTNVQFLVGTKVLTNETAAPYLTTTNNLAAGSYTLAAVATDNNGLKATNTATISVVAPVTVSLSSPARTAKTNFQFSYTANVGLRYMVQRSTNLVSTNWVTIITNLAGGSSVNFTDTAATVNPGFYRVGRLPNP
jgi:plastocyanin